MWRSLYNATYPSSPQCKPYDFQPDAEPEESDSADGRSLEDESTQQEGNQKDNNQRNDIEEVADKEAGTVNALEYLGKVRRRILWRLVLVGFLMQRIGGNIELVGRLGSAHPGSARRLGMGQRAILCLLHGIEDDLFST
jgi:hypothetical protein